MVSLPAELAAELAEAREILERVRARATLLHAEIELDADDTTDAEAAEERAERARRGELGAAWRAVQQRIDLGQTSLADVFGGVDDTPEAQRLLATARTNLDELEAELNAETEDETATSVIDELAALNAGLASRLDRIRAWEKQ